MFSIILQTTTIQISWRWCHIEQQHWRLSAAIKMQSLFSLLKNIDPLFHELQSLSFRQIVFSMKTVQTGTFAAVLFRCILLQMYKHTCLVKAYCISILMCICEYKWRMSDGPGSPRECEFTACLNNANHALPYCLNPHSIHKHVQAVHRE